VPTTAGWNACHRRQLWRSLQETHHFWKAITIQLRQGSHLEARKIGFEGTFLRIQVILCRASSHTCHAPRPQIEPMAVALSVKRHHQRMTWIMAGSKHMGHSAAPLLWLLGSSHTSDLAEQRTVLIFPCFNAPVLLLEV
jgi:hypothetical protein